MFFETTEVTKDKVGLKTLEELVQFNTEMQCGVVDGTLNKTEDVW